jgi:hypothetical protein
MPNGDSLEEKKKRLRELWGRASGKYPSLADVQFPINEQTGRLTPAAVAAYTAAKQGSVTPSLPTPAPTPAAPAPTTPAPTGPGRAYTALDQWIPPGPAGMQAYVERRSRAGEIPVLTARPQRTPQGNLEVGRYGENITYLDDKGEEVQGGWDADIYVDPEGQVRRRSDKPVLPQRGLPHGPGRPSEAEPWKQDELLGKALTVQSAGGPAGAGVRTQRLAHAEPDWLKRKIADPAAAVGRALKLPGIARAAGVTGPVIPEWTKKKLEYGEFGPQLDQLRRIYGPGPILNRAPEALGKSLAPVRAMLPEKTNIGVDVPLGGTAPKIRRDAVRGGFYQQPLWEQILNATPPMEAGFLVAQQLRSATQGLKKLEQIAVTTRPERRMGTASQILSSLGETSDDANRAVANARRQHQEFTLLPGKPLEAEVRHHTKFGKRQLDAVINLPNSPFKDRESLIQTIAKAETETVEWIKANLSNSQHEVINGLYRTAANAIARSKAPSTIYVKGRITRAYNLNPAGPTKDDIAWLIDKDLQEFALNVGPAEKSVAGGAGIIIPVSAGAQAAVQEVAQGQGKRLITTVGADVARPTLQTPVPAPAPAARAADVPTAPRKRTVEELLEAGEYKLPQTAEEVAEQVNWTINQIQDYLDSAIREARIFRSVETKARKVFDDLDEFSDREVEFLEDLVPDKVVYGMLDTPPEDILKLSDIQTAMREEIGKSESRIQGWRTLLIEKNKLDLAAREAAMERGIGRIGLEEAAPAAPRAADVPVTPAITPAAETVARAADVPVTPAAPTPVDFLKQSAREAARVAPGEQARQVTHGLPLRPTLFEALYQRGVAAGGGPPGPPTTGRGSWWERWEPGRWSSSPDAAKRNTLEMAHHLGESPEALMQGARPLGWVPFVGKRIKPIKISGLQRFSGAQDALRFIAEKAMNSGDLIKANKLQKVIGWFTRLANRSVEGRHNPGAREVATHSLFENDQNAWLTDILARFTAPGRFPVVEGSRRSGLFMNPWLRGEGLRLSNLIDSKGSINLRISKSHPLITSKTLKPDGTFWKAGDIHPVLFGDMMEAPSRYMLTADQRAWVDDAHTVVRELTDEFIEVLRNSKSPIDHKKLAKFLDQIADAQRLRDEEGLEHYWPRFAEASDGSAKIVNRTGGQLDSIDHASFMQERIMPTMQKGVERGVNYEANPNAVLSLWARAILEQKRNALTIASLSNKKLLVRTPRKGYSPSTLFGDYDKFYLLDPKDAGDANPKSALEQHLRAPWQERTAAVPFGESPNQLAWAIAQVFRGAKSATATTKTTMTGLLDIGTSLLHTTTVVGIGRTRDALQVGMTPGDVFTAGGMVGGPQAFVKGVGKSAIVFLGELGPSGTRGIYQRNLYLDDMMRQGHEIGGMNYDPMIEYFAGVSGLSGIGQGKWGRKAVLPALAGKVVGPVLGRFGRASSAAFNQGVSHGRAAMFDSYYQILRVKARDLILQRTPALRDWAANPQSRARLEKLLEAEMNTQEMRQEALRLGRRVDGMLGVTNARGLGISRTQQDVEGTAFLFSSVYTRSLLGQMNVLAGSGAMPKETAYILARSLGAAATTIFTIRLELERRRGASFGEAWRRSVRSLNPRNGREFMAIPVGNGWYGLGGFYRSVAVFIGAASDAEEWDWGEGTLEMIKGNPITRFWRGRQPPIAGLVTDILEGEKFTGEPFDLTDFFDVTDPEEALEAWFEQVGPFNIEAVIESTSSGATPWAIAAAVGLETLGGRYVPIRGSDIKQQAIDNFISAEPVRAMEMEPPLTYLTKPKDLSKAESNEILAHSDNADLVVLINELEEKQRGWYGEEGKFWTAVHKRREQMIESLEQLEKDAEAHAAAKTTTLDRPGVSGQPRNYNEVAERYYIANYQSILADYYNDIDDLMTQGREEGWLKKGEGAPKAKRIGVKAQRDYFVLMDGDLDEEHELLSEAYERVVRPYLKKEYGVEGKYSPLEIGVQQQIDYNEYHLRLEALRAYYGSKLIDATRTAHREKLPDMEKARRDDADYIRENYYNIKISSQVLDRFFRSEETKKDFVRYVRASQSNKQAMLNAAPEGSPIQLFPQIEASSVIRDFKLDARRKDSRLEETLVKWGGVQKPIWEYSLRQGAAWFRMPK